MSVLAKAIACMFVCGGRMFAGSLCLGKEKVRYNIGH